MKQLDERFDGDEETALKLVGNTIGFAGFQIREAVEHFKQVFWQEVKRLLRKLRGPRDVCRGCGRVEWSENLNDGLCYLCDPSIADEMKQV